MPQPPDLGCPTDYEAINMVPYEQVAKVLQEGESAEEAAQQATT